MVDIRPAKVLSIELISITSAELVNDVGSVMHNFPFRWSVTIKVNGQQTSNPSYGTLGTYNGNDVSVGDWITTTSKARSLKLVTLHTKNASTVTGIVEDINYFNALQDEDGNRNGAIPVGNGILFEVDSNNMPILAPLPNSLPGALTQNFATQLLSNFNYRNILFPVSTDLTRDVELALLLSII